MRMEIIKEKDGRHLIIEEGWLEYFSEEDWERVEKILKIVFDKK